MALLCMLVSGFGLWIVHELAERALLQGLRVHLEDIALITADQMDAAAHQTLADPASLGTPAYEQASAPLLRLRKQVPDIFYAYSLIWREGRPVFILDSSYYVKNKGDTTEVASPGEIYEDAPSALAAAWETGRPASSEEPYTDKWGTFLSAFAPFRDKAGRPAGVVGVDISMEHLAARKKPMHVALAIAALSCLLGSAVIGVLRARSHAKLARREAELEIARAEAERGGRAKSVFLATMSHEIRTPLNGVLGMAEALSHTPLDETQREQLRVIRNSGNLLLVMLNDILDFSKIEAGSMRVNTEPFPLAAVIEDSANLHRSSAAQKGLSLTVESAPDAPRHVLADATRTSQIVGNLLSNAIKFTDQGSVRVKIGRAPGGMARITVEDTGIGIPADRLKELFVPFSQLNTALNRRVGGTGLGLTISRRLAELMGGTLDVESRDGLGSSFHLALPAAAEPAAPAQPRETAPQPPVCSKLTVLVAEDVAANRKVVAHFLQRLGIKPVFAEDGIAAVRQWRELRPDVILMDVQMPRMDGREATRQIRAECGHLERPWIIALTGGVLDEDRDEAAKAGMNDFVAKPVASSNLAAALAKVPPVNGR